MNTLDFTKMNNAFLLLILLSAALLNFSCQEVTPIENTAENIMGEERSEPELHEIIRRFLNDVYGVKEIEIKVSSKRIKTEQNEKAFRVLCDNNSRRGVIIIDVITGQVLECDIHVVNDSYHELIKQRNPEKYAEYRAYRDNNQKKT